MSNIDVQDKTVDAGHLAVKRGGPAIGLVLGSGAARGFAHIGVMRALQAHGIAPDIEVWQDPKLVRDGHDPQLERAVAEAMQQLKDHPLPTYKEPPAPDHHPQLPPAE